MPEISITTTYCDDTVRKEEFENDSYNKMVARDRTFDLYEEAKRNMTVFAKFPHIIKVIFVQPEIANEPIVETFPCKCSDQRDELVTTG